MDITLKDKNGVILHTAKKYCNEDININIESQEIEINPSTEEQIKEGLFNKLTVPGDIDLIPENIKKGINIFGVDGGFDAVDTRDATATSNDIVEGTTAYVNNQKIDGNVPNNGELEFEPSDEEQTIPAGITTGGAVKAADITKLTHYKKCLGLASEIMTGKPHHKYLQYIGNSNTGAWVDTGVKLTSTISIEATIRSYTAQVSGEKPLYAFLGAWKDNDGLIFGRRNDGYYMTTGASDVFSGTELQMTNFHTFVYDPVNNIYTVNGKSLAITKTNGVDANIYLFNANGWSYAKSQTQISSCKIYDNGVLIHDYVPIVRAIDNVVCFYDTVTETYLEHKGSGGMFAGPEITG